MTRSDPHPHLACLIYNTSSPPSFPHDRHLSPNGKFSPSCRDPSSTAEDTWISHTVGRRCYKCTPLNSRCSMLHTLHIRSRILDFVSVGKGCHCMWNQSSLFSYVSLFPFRFRSSTPYSALTPFTAFSFNIAISLSPSSSTRPPLRT